ncbi:pyridoxamine 5'-phosphate oxidase family protein, partial [Streptacidiphilus jiangxiensis]
PPADRPAAATIEGMKTLPAEHLDRGSALGLLADARSGRVIYTAAAMPAVWPSLFHLAPDGGVLLRTAADSGLAQAIGGTLVAFEADDLHTEDGTGWCVTLLGRAVVGAEDHTTGTLEIHILPEAVHGRRFPASADA